MRRHLLLEHQLRDRDRVEGRVVWSLSGRAVVLNRGQRLEHQLRGHLGGEVVLHLPFQLHPPVLKPGPHLREDRDTVNVRETQNDLTQVIKSY